MNRAAFIALKTMKWFGIVLIALLLLYFGVLVFLDFNRFREPVSRLVLERTGRVLKINGKLDLTPGWPLPRIRVEDVSFANPDWAREAHMFALKKAEVAISLPRLLARRIHFTEVLLAEPSVALEIAPDGRKTWLLDPEQRDEKSSIGIDRLRIDEGVLNFYQPGNKINLRASFSVGEKLQGQRRGWRKLWDIEDAKGDADRRSDTGVRFSIKGRYKGVPVTAQGTGGSVFSIRDENFAYPLDVKGTLADAALSAKGTVNGLTTLAAMDLNIMLRGRSLSALEPVAGVALPQTKPYSTSGRLRHEDKLWRYDDFSGKIGDSDIVGHVSVNRGDELTSIRGDFTSRLLQMSDFPFGEKKPAATKKQGLLPDTPLNPEAWEGFDADIRLKAARVLLAKLPLRDLDAQFTLKDKLASLEPFRARVAEGAISMNLSLDGRNQPLQGKAEGQLQKVSLRELAPATAKAGDKISPGRLDGRFRLAGSGNSLDALLGNADGRFSLVMQGGEISAFVMEAVGIDLWEMLKFKMRGDQNIAIHCGVADFGVRKGLAQAQVAVLDTEDTKVTITGNIDLGKETLDLTLHPEPKDMSPVSLRSPIRVRGSLSEPKFVLDKTRMTMRGLGSLALAVINPLLALAPLIETGPGLDSDCGKLIADAKAAQNKLPTGRAATQGSRSRERAN